MMADRTAGSAWTNFDIEVFVTAGSVDGIAG
jgi:hypothetical protein